MRYATRNVSSANLSGDTMRNFDATWMTIAETIATMSTCRVNVGCVLVQSRRMIGLGYVGSVSGEKHCADVGCLFVDSPATGRKSCVRTIHAEMNSIINANKISSDHVTCYSTTQPCVVCLKMLIQFGVTRVCYRQQYVDIWRDAYIADLSRKPLIEEIAHEEE